MQASNNLRYFARRERDETILAERADDPSARNAHLSMARRYRARIDQLQGAATH